MPGPHNGRQVLTPNVKRIGLFALIFFNVAAILSLKNFPLMALEGYASLFYLLVSALLFFIPTSLVIAELSSAWPHKGGVYHWVSEAFGRRWGVVALWLQWVQSMIWYPTILSFVAMGIAYFVAPKYAMNNYFLFIVMALLFSVLTWLHSLGTRVTKFIIVAGVIFGALLPCVIFVIFSIYMIITNPSFVSHVDVKAFFPHLGHIAKLDILVGVMVGLCGMEIAAVHANDVTEPQASYPKAVYFAVIIIIFAITLGALALTLVMPDVHLQGMQNTMQVYEKFFHITHAAWFTHVMAIMLSIGGLASLMVWVSGPSKSWQVVAEDGIIHPFFQKTNSKGVPKNILWVQALIVVFFISLYLIVHDLAGFYWAVLVFAAQSYILMYVLMMLAALKLRFKEKDQPRPYKIPGPYNVGMWLVVMIGIVGAAFAWTIGFVPPAELSRSHIAMYEGFLIFGFFAMVVIPLLIYYRRNPGWYKK